MAEEEQTTSPVERYESLPNQGQVSQLTAEIKDNLPDLVPGSDGWVSLIGNSTGWVIGRKIETGVQIGFAESYSPNQSKVRFLHNNTSEPLNPDVKIKWQMTDK